VTVFGSDLIAVFESNDAAAFQAAIGAVEKVDPAVSVSAVKLTRTLMASVIQSFG
jgi:hypothetical protein